MKRQQVQRQLFIEIPSAVHVQSAGSKGMAGQPPGFREVHVATTSQGARLAGAKAPSYVRAVNEVEARSSGYTARYMLTSDVAYVLTAAEMNLTPAESAKPLLEALLALIDDLDAIDTTTPPATSWRSARRGCVRKSARSTRPGSIWDAIAAKACGPICRGSISGTCCMSNAARWRACCGCWSRRRGPYSRRWRPTTIIFNIPALARWASICSRGCRCSCPIWNGWSRWSSVWTMARRSSVRARRCTRCMTR